MITLSTRQFVYNKSTRQLSAEDSDLPKGYLYQVFPDSADLGLRIHNERTGTTVVFVHDHIQQLEDDVLWDEFVVHRALNKHLSNQQWNKVFNMRVTIFND